MRGSTSGWQVVAVIASGLGLLTACGIGAAPGSPRYQPPPPVTTTISAPNLRFADTGPGHQSEPLTVTLTNPGSATVRIGRISVEGHDPRSFPFETNCGRSLAAGADCSIQVRFRPGQPDLNTALLMVRIQAAAGHIVALAGSGVGGG